MRLQLPRFFSFILILSFLLISSAFAQSENPEPYRQDRVIIKFKNAMTTNAQKNIRAALNVSNSKALELIGAQVWELTGITADNAIARFKDNPGIEYIEPDYTLYATEQISTAADSVQVFPNDPRFAEMWGLHNTGQNGGTPDADIDAPEAWSITTGKEIVIGVIDSGTDWRHVDLADNIWINQGEIPENGIDDDKNGYVDDVRGWDFFDNDNEPMDEAGHGTHVSGTIAAAGNNKIGVVGVNWSAKIMILRFLGPNGNGSTSDAIQAIEYAMRMNAHLTNNSWGGGEFSQALKDAIAAAGNAGQLFVAAAGNTGLNSDITPHYPSSFDLDNIISVANTMRNDVLSVSSTYGVVTVDLAAPGTNVLSTLPGNSYGNFSGTSMASPHVAGVASLLLSIDPAMTPVAVKDLIMANVDTLESLKGRVATSGRLNAYKALLAAEQDSIAPAPVTDLQAGEPTSNSIILRWTASGDDSTTGKAAAYDIRYSVEPIDAKNFQFAEIATDPPAPQEAGAPESFTIKGLDFSTTYYVALRVIDNVGNESDISNLASAVTLGAPNILVSTDSLSDELLTGATSIQTFNIKNDAEGTLDFGINIEGISASQTISAIRISAPRSDGNGDERKAQYELARNRSPEKNGFSGTLPQLDQRSRVWLARFESALADSFIIFQDDMESGENGWSHYATSGSIDSWKLSNNRANSGVMSWHVAQQLDIGAEALQSPPIDLTPYDNAMLSFYHWYDFDDCGDPTFEPDGGIVEISIDNGSTWQQIFPVAGYPHILDMSCSNPLENRAAYAHTGGDSTNYIPDFFDLSAFTGNVVRLRFHAGWDCGNCDTSKEGWYIDDVAIYSRNFVSWLSAAPVSGTVFAGDSVEVTVTFDALGLNAGGFDARINISSNDPGDSLVAIPAHLNVIGAPDIFAKIDTLDFGEIFTGQTDTLRLLIENKGTDVLDISGVTVQPAEFSVEPAVALIAPAETATFSIVFVPENPGELAGTLSFTSNDPDEQVFTIALKGKGVPPPVIAVSPDSLSEQLFTGETAQQSMTIANNGGSDLNFAIEITGVQNSGASMIIRDGNFTERIASREWRKRKGFVSQLLDSDSDIPPDGAPTVSPPGLIAPQAATLPFRDGFEDGDFADWFIDDTTGQREITNETAARGQNSFHYSNAIQGHFHGIHQEFDASQPNYMGFYIRSGSSTQSDAYFLITANGESRNSVILFFARSNGFFFANGSTPGGDESFKYNANQWYHIEFKDLNWVEKHFDYYVDGDLITEDIPFRNTSLVNSMDRVYLYNFSSGAQAWWDEITIGGTGSLWLDAKPLKGTIAANSQLEIDVLFDASGLKGDVYRANLEISSNDPVTPKMALPVSLHVSDAPDIAVSKDSLNYGEVFIGVNVADTLEVANNGTDTLRVTGIVTGRQDFSVDPASFDLSPGAKQLVAVILNASAQEEIAATLKITSNDPDESELTVALTATALIPPKISVAPDSLAQALFTGETASQIFTISNEKADGDTLDFSISVSQNDSAASTLSMSYRFIGQINATGADAKKSIPQARSNQRWGDHPATGLQISGGEITRQNNYSGNPLLPIVIADPEGDGGIVDVIALRALSGPEFVDFQIDFSTIIDPVSIGGAVSLDLDQNPNTGAPPSFGAPEQDIGAEYELFFFSLSTGLVQLMRGPIVIANYPVEISDKSLRFSVLLADVDNDDGLIDVTGVLGTSSGPTDWFPDAGHGTIQKGVNWLLPDPLSGSIPGGASLEVEVIFNANGLKGGDYFADIAVASNDPFSPLVTLSAHLAVTSAPDIALSDSSLDFGTVFIDFTKQDSFLVANTGTDVLQVTSITSDNPEFTIDVSAFSIEPEKIHTVLLTYAPKTEQTSTGILVIHSNDPDEPVVEVAATGQGLFPPDIAVDPSRFNFFVNPGDSASAVMTIANNGSSPLRFSIRDEEQEANAAGNDENLFWGVTAEAALDTLYRTDFNNAKTEAIFLGNGLRGLAIDEDQQRIYFAVTGDGAIRVSNFDGSSEHFIVKGLNNPVEIALDTEAGKIYWVDFAENLIARANVDGSDLEVIILGAPTFGNTGVAPNEKGDATANKGGEKTLALNRPWGIALDLLNSKVYWSEQSGNRIARANLDGAQEETIIAPADSINGPRGIEVDAAIGKIFFVDSFNGMLKRANLDGSEIETLLTFESSDNALSLALDRIAQKIYWTDNGADAVSRANYDGSDVEIVVKTNVAGFNGPFGLAVTPRTGWLSKAPAQGTLEAGESADILLNVDATGLQEGDYVATIFVESNDPDESQVEIPISLQVNKAQVVLSTPDTLQALPGDTLNVPVTIFFMDTTAEISALGAAMKASGNMLTFLGYTPGPILSGQVFNINSPAPDSVRMALIALNQAPLSQSGLLATLHFQVDTAATGDDFIMKYSDLSAGDPNGQAIPIAAIDGRVLIRTHTITGTILYSMVDGAGDKAKPVAALDVELVQNASVVRRTKSAQSGEYELLNIRPGRDYRVKVGRKSGGMAAALTPTDALLVVQAFLGAITFTGSQNLAADADGNHTINPTDAGLIFNRFLGRITQFPIDDWRTYPSNYNNNEPADAWKTTPGSKEYRNLQNNFADQDYLAVAIGDADLSWPESAPSAGANALAKGKSASQNAATLNLQVSAVELSPFTKETTIQILANGDVLANGVYALGGELRYDATSLEVFSVRWGEIIPKDGFNTDYRILSENSVTANNQNQNEDRHLANGRIRFGGFSTSDARINSAGVLLEVDVRQISAHASGTALPLTLVDLSAVYGGKSAMLADRKNSASSATEFVMANISASDGAVVASAPPKEFALEQNYPNPFNPTTRIRYQLPKASRVRIVLFNAIGHRILTLVDKETQDAGYYTIEWNGRDTAGRSVASGVYLYRIEAVGANHSFAKTKKMLFIK